jgi:outer membrane lipoprotein carrier protein
MILPLNKSGPISCMYESRSRSITLRSLITISLLGILIASTDGLAKKSTVVTVPLSQKIQDKYRKVESFEAAITQEVYQAALGRTKTSTGSLQLQKPNFIRWETHEPETNILVSNGNRLWYFTPALDPKGKGQVIQRSASTIKNQAVYRILTGTATFDKEFTLLGEVQKDELTELTMKPIKTMGEVREIKLSVNKKFEIVELLLKNSGENTTRIRLQNTKLGGKFPPNLFDFKPPPGSEILKE